MKNQINQSQPPSSPSPLESQPPQTDVIPPVRQSPFELPDAEPWPHPVDGKTLLDLLVALLRRFVVLPNWAAETLALWILHTYAFHCRQISTYLGVESPEKRCGKTTLLTVLSALVHRPVVAANISPPALFRVIEETCPTLLIDEADTLLLGNDELRGILNSGYTRKTAYVVRVASQSAFPDSTLARFSCWCPKVMAAIGRLPDTLADRCIVLRMQRKIAQEQCERLRNLDPDALRRQCARFALDHAQAIAAAQPQIPPTLNDRAADIWEPLLVLADLAGGHWPASARQAAVALSVAAHETNPIGSLLFDIFSLFVNARTDRMFTRDLLLGLTDLTDRPWTHLLKGRDPSDLWLSQQLRPYGVRPKTIRTDAGLAKGYLEADLMDVFRRYIPRSEVEAVRNELVPAADIHAASPDASSEPSEVEPPIHVPKA